MYKNIDKNLIPTELANIVLLMVENKETYSDYSLINNLIMERVALFPQYTEEQIRLLFFDFILYSFYEKKENKIEIILEKINKMLIDNIFPKTLFNYSLIESIFTKNFINENEKILLYKELIENNEDLDCIKFLYLNKLIKILIYSGKFLTTYKDLYLKSIELKDNFPKNIISLTDDLTSGFFYRI